MKVVEQIAKLGHIWLACKNCGKERYVRKDKLKKPNYTGLCPACSMSLVRRTYHYGKANWNWKLGRVKLSGGYIGIKLYPGDFFYPMATKDGYVAEHRLVVAKALCRCLLPWEIVHHKGVKYTNGSIEDKQDNRYPENLELITSQKYHFVDSLAKAYIRRLENKIIQLEAKLKAFGGEK